MKDRIEERSSQLVRNLSSCEEAAIFYLIFHPRQGTQANAIAPPSRIQALVGEHAQRQQQLTPESHHRINTYYASIDKVLSELELRFSGDDQETDCHSETPDKESFSRVAKFYKIDGEILEGKQKMYTSFVVRTD